MQNFSLINAVNNSPLKVMCRACRGRRQRGVFKLLLIFLSLPFISIAQEKENLGTEVVNIVKPYSPTISDAFKVKETPILNDSTNTEKKEVNYSIFSVPVASTFTPAKGKATSVEKAKPIKLYDNYASLGFGNYTNILAEFYSNFEVSRTDNFGLYLKHNSSQGGIDGIRLEDKFYDTKLEGNYTSRQKELSYQIKAGVEHQMYNWYGLSSLFDNATDVLINSIDSKHSFFSGFAGGSLSLEDFYFKSATANIRYLSDSFSSSEINFSILPEFSFPITDYTINVDVDLDYLSGKFDKDYYDVSDIKYSFLNVGVIPSFDYVTEDLSVSIGFAGYVSLDSENSDTNLYIYPKVKASYRLMDELLIVYGGVDGGLTQNSYYSFKEDNPFVSPTMYIMPTNQQYNGFAGIKGKLTNTLAYNLRTSYGREEDKALFVKNPTKQFITGLEGYEYGNSFAVAYDDVTTLSVFGELNLEISDNFSLGINGTFNSYDTSKQPEAWNLPELEATLFSNFNITKKIYGGVSLFYVGERKDLIYNPMFPTFAPTKVTLDSYIDANVNLGYHFNNQLSFFIKGANLFGDNYQKWMNYPVQGIQVLGGASYKFDW